MSESHPEPHEALLPGLEYAAGAFELPADVAALRKRLLRDTSHVVRGHRRRKQALRTAGWGLAYVAGVLSAWFGLRQFTSDATPNQAIAVQQPPSPPVKESNAKPPKQKRVTPEQLRARVAGASRTDQIEFLRRAGDLYLNERNDLRSAVTCYQQVLELAETPEQLAVLPDDSWLLAELKNAQRTQ